MLNFWKKYWKPGFDVALIILTVYIFMLLFSLIFKIATPIFIAFAIHLMTRPLTNFLHRRGIKKNIAVTISTLLFVTILLGFFIVLGAVITSQVENIAKMMPRYSHVYQSAFDNTVNYAQTKYEALPEDTAKSIKENFGKYAEKGATLLSGVLVSVFSFLSSIPKLIANLLIGLILSFFLSLEIDSWNKLAKEKTPKTFKNIFNFLRENVIKGIGSYIKSQLILIFFTFAIVLIGFLIFGVKGAFTLAIFAAVLDVLPLLGVSTLFIPWIVYLFIVGNSVLAIKLSILLAIVLIFRQIMEPKITGDSLGVSGFTMLSFMIVSTSVFGIAGLLLSPVIIILIKALIDQGLLKEWIRIPKEEFEEDEVKAE